MDWYKTVACHEIDINAKKLHTLSDNLWKASLSAKTDGKCIDLITKVLKEHEFDLTFDLNGMPGTFKAEYGKSSTPQQTRYNIAFICRYSKAGKKSQFKGNNLVAELAIAAAIGIKSVLQLSCPTIGKVTVFGCPDTPTGELATLVNLRVFRDVDVVMLAIPANRTDWNPRFATRKTFRATYRGVDPNDGVKCIDERSACLMAYQNVLLMQEHFEKDWKVKASFGRTGLRNECRTIICSSAPTYSDLFYLEKRIKLCLDAAAEATGCQYELDMAQKTYHTFINNTQLCYLLQMNAYHCGTLATPLRSTDKLMEPVDAANMSHVVPTLMPLFYIGSDADMNSVDFESALHEHQAQAFTIAIAKALAMTAVDVLNTTSGTTAKVKADLKESLSTGKSVKFKPFFGRLPQKKVIATELPFDTNTGWSKQP